MHDSVVNIIRQLDTYLVRYPGPKPIVIIQTDGEDTTSKTNAETVKTLVRERTEAGWKFVLIAMGTNGKLIGSSMGFKAESILDYKTGRIIEAFQSIAKLTQRAAKGEEAVFQLEDHRAQR